MFSVVWSKSRIYCLLSEAPELAGMSSQQSCSASLLAVFGGALFLFLASPAVADLQDPLHGYCAGVGQCVDNGTNSPTSTNPPSNFGFTISPGPQTGDLR